MVDRGFRCMVVWFLLWLVVLFEFLKFRWYVCGGLRLDSCSWFLKCVFIGLMEMVISML